MSDQTNRYVRTILTPESVRNIANYISSTIQRRLNDTEIADLYAYIKSRATQNWTGMAPAKIRENIANTFIESRFTARGRERLRDDVVDVHEILKKHIGTHEQEPDYEAADNVDTEGYPIRRVDSSSHGGVSEVKTTIEQITNISGFLGKTDDSSFLQLVNPQAVLRKNYIILDSFYRDTSVDTPGSGITNFQWNFLANSNQNRPGAINSLGNVQQLVSMTCPNIRIPYQNNALVNSYKRITMTVNEFSGQSYIGQEGRKFHFMFSTELDTNMLECSTLFSSGKSTFEFAKPITQIDTITISFACPLEPLVFDMDRSLMAVSYQAQARLTSTVPHKLQTGDQVYLRDFTTGNPIADTAIIQAANRIQGYNVFVIDALTVDLPDLDLSSVTPIVPYTVQVLFGSKRVFVPLELKYIPNISKNN